MRFTIYTLGCKVNQYETQAMEQELCRRGHQCVDDGEKVDVCIVNTCTVTSVSDHKCRQMIRRCKKDNPKAVIAVCGCYSQTHDLDVEELEIDVLAGTANRMEFLEAVEQAVETRKSISLKQDILHYHTFEILPPGGMTTRTRAMLKVEDGCQNFCSYCMIPFARGPVRSCPLSKCVEDAKKLQQEGYKEIVITGIEISSYGQDFKDGTTIIDLLEAICNAVPNVRIRFGSLEPRTITEDFVQRASKLPNLCHHFHLSMQSGCNATLKRMNRRYTTERFYESCVMLRKTFEDVTITTDMITGFPEETEEEFLSSLAFIQKCGFMAMHIFPYSIREGTKAGEMVQIPKMVKEERAERATEISRQMHQKYLESMVGTTVEVLFEQEKNGRFCGHAKNYVEVGVNGEKLHNEIRNVTITGVNGDSLIGEIV